MSLFSGCYKCISIDNLSAYLNKICVFKAKIEIASSAFPFSNFIMDELMSKQIKIKHKVRNFSEM